MDLSELFGMQKPEEPDEKQGIALLLMFLADMLSSKRDEKHVQRESEKTQEIPVRPRVEPLGGS